MYTKSSVTPVMTPGFKITELYAFVVIDDDLNGSEGVPAVGYGTMLYPLVGADTTRIESFRGIARKIAKEEGVTIELRKFTGMEVVEVFGALEN